MTKPAPSPSPKGIFGWVGIRRDGSIDGWFWRRLNIYMTELACFLIAAYITVNHVAAVHGFLGGISFASNTQASATDSVVTENLIWWSFALWGTCVIVHVFGPSAETLITSLATAVAAKFGVQVGATTTSTVLASTVTTAAKTGEVHA